MISSRALKEVDQSLTFEQLLENPEMHKGKTVLLGCTIIDTRDSPDRTSIIVLQRPLGFLDPAIYHPGREITVVGSVLGKEVRSLGEIEYTYPVIEKKELYLWPRN